MQLTSAAACGPSLRIALAAATATLLNPALAQAPAPAAGTAAGAGASRPASAPASSTAPAAEPAWRIDSAVLVYGEAGGRVRAVEPVIGLTRTDASERTLGLKLTLDALTGASPNGAVPQPAPQTFTSPSGKSTYTVPAGATPLDTSFKDRRAAIVASLERPFGERQRRARGASLSSEYDFTSLAANAALARDFDDRNTTMSLGVAFESDRIRPVGGAPVGLRPAFGALAAKGGSQTRTVVDLLAGLTQVMSRRWLTQLNLGIGRGSGYHNDPYKILSVIDGTSGLVTGDGYVSEQRPDARTRTSLYWQNKLHLTRDVLDVGYRFYRDDWGVRAHTLDVRYRFELGGGWHLQPRWRAHRQSAADFWHGWLVEGGEWSSTTHRSTLEQASADPRLAAFSAHTLGLTFGLPLGRDGELGLRLESYRQSPKQPAGAPGALQGLPLAPTLKATMLLLGYTTRF
jgi:hypothetical protein